MVVDSAAQMGNGTNGATPTQSPHNNNNFAASGVAATSTQTPAVTQYDYGVVYNNRPPVVESGVTRGYGAPTTTAAPAQYGMTTVHPSMSAPAPPPHAAHPQAYPMHAGAGAHPQMRHGPYGPPPHPHAPHPHPGYSYAAYSAPPPPAPEWAPQGFVNGHQHGWDAYAHHSHHPQQHQNHIPVVQPQSVGTSSGTMGGDQGHGHRIQLAPIPAENHTNNSGANGVSPTSPVRSSHSSNVNSSSPASMRSNGRVEDSVHGYQSQGKKNPLSIGNIISNDAR